MSTNERLPKDIEKKLVEQGIIKEEHTMTSFIEDIVIRKPHISYDTFSESWLCSSEDGPWDICIGSGESVVEAYRDWAGKCPRMAVEIPKHWSGGCQDGGEWRLA